MQGVFGKDKASDKGGGVLSDFAEVKAMVIAYAKQETIEPIKGLARFIAFGLLGSFLLSAGVLFLGLSGLRALQTETGTTFAGHWSWAPYLLTFLGMALIGGLAFSRIGAKR